MVIMNSIDEKDTDNKLGIDNNMNQYVYLVDNAQQMMLILKRDLNKTEESCPTNETAAIQRFVIRKVGNLLDRIRSNGPLSLREIEVLNYAATGKSNKQIAEIIGLSESTIKNHFSNTLRKLHANDRTHAVTLALCNGWLNEKNISSGLINEKSQSQ